MTLFILKWCVLFSVLSLVSSFTPRIMRTKGVFRNKTTFKNNTVDSRIFGGSEAQNGQFPYIIYLIFNMRETCTGSLITPDKVLTAGHCPGSLNPNPLDIWMVAGTVDVDAYKNKRIALDNNRGVDERSLNLQERRGKEIQFSPKYGYLPEENTIRHDVLVITPDRPFVLGVTVQTIPIATERLCEQRRCTILGFGLKENDVIPSKLMFSNKIHALPESECTEGQVHLILEKGSSGICQGDSGGPLVCEETETGQFVTFGVASYVLSAASSPCGEDVQEVFSELYVDLNWLTPYLLRSNPSSSTPKEDTKRPGGTASISAPQPFICILLVIYYLL